MNSGGEHLGHVGKDDPNHVVMAALGTEAVIMLGQDNSILQDRASCGESAPVATVKPELLDPLREALRSSQYSRGTEQTYCHWSKRQIFFHNVRGPAEMSETDINAFLTDPGVKEKVSASTQKHALSALLFLYRHVIEREVCQDIHAVQELLRRAYVKTSMICTHVLKGGPSGVRSPANGL